MEYPNKRLRHCLLFSFTLLTSITLPSQKPIIPFVYNTVPVMKDLQLQQWISQCRLVIIPTILGIALYFSKQTLTQNISEHPLIFLAVSYVAGNYLIDSLSKYRQLTQTLQFFRFSQTMSRYMLCIIAVKNSMKKFNETNGLPFDEEEFLTTITTGTGHSLEELELFTFELLNSSIHAIRNLCIDINTTDIEEKIYFLFKEQISLEQMLLVCKNDQDIYKQLVQFYKNPAQEYEVTLQKLCSLIHDHFNYFIKKKLHFM